MFFDDSIANARAEARAFAHWFSGVERIEGAIQVRESRPCILDFKSGSGSLRESTNRDLPGVTFSLHRVAGIIHQVQKNLLELVLIHRRQAGV